MLSGPCFSLLSKIHAASFESGPGNFACLFWDRKGGGERNNLILNNQPGWLWNWRLTWAVSQGFLRSLSPRLIRTPSRWECAPWLDAGRTAVRYDPHNKMNIFLKVQKIKKCMWGINAWQDERFSSYVLHWIHRVCAEMFVCLAFFPHVCTLKMKYFCETVLSVSLCPSVPGTSLSSSVLDFRTCSYLFHLTFSYGTTRRALATVGFRLVSVGCWRNVLARS